MKIAYHTWVSGLQIHRVSVLIILFLWRILLMSAYEYQGYATMKLSWNWLPSPICHIEPWVYRDRRRNSHSWYSPFPFSNHVLFPRSFVFFFRVSVQFPCTKGDFSAALMLPPIICFLWCVKLLFSSIFGIHNLKTNFNYEINYLFTKPELFQENIL